MTVTTWVKNDETFERWFKTSGAEERLKATGFVGLAYRDAKWEIKNAWEALGVTGGTRELGRLEKKAAAMQARR